MQEIWRRQGHYRWLAHGASIVGGLLALLLVGLTAGVDLASGHASDEMFFASAAVILVVGVMLPRFAVQALWREKTRRQLDGWPD